MGDVGSGIADVTAHLAHNTNVLVTVQQRVFFFLASRLPAAVGCPVCLEGGIRKDDNQSFRVLVACGDGHVLLGNKPWELGRRKRLGSCWVVSAIVIWMTALLKCVML